MGMYLTWLADVLRGAGLTVIEEPGWQSRGFAASSSPGGAMVALTGGLAHHTATSDTLTGDYPTKKVILEGRPDVPPPLSQLGLGRGGAWYVFAAGRSNHSGAVDDVRYSNPRCVGVEAEHPGGSTPWPAHQYRSYVRGCAAIGLYAGITWRGHKEAAVPKGRKPDPTFDMDTFRAEVAAMQAELRAHGISVQEALNAAGYPVTVDGKVGPETVAATRCAQQALGLEVDGYPGPVTLAALNGTPTAPPTGGIGGGMSPVVVPAPAPAPTPAPTPSLFPLLVDGDWGPITTKGLQTRLGRLLVDGHFGPVTVKRLQAYLGGLYVDGDFGPKTKRALQARLGVVVDGWIGPVTVKALQTRLNRGAL